MGLMVRADSRVAVPAREPQVLGAVRSVRAVAFARALVMALLLPGCASTSDRPPEGLAYYWQSLRGHLAMVNAARPVQDWLADEATAPALREQLALTQRIRTFAVRELALPDNASYRRYADLKRSAVVWNVVAAPPDALTLRTWCFAVVGCVGYRGYFEEADARAMAARLQAEGWETHVYGVPAYSTLGWGNWLGGDPLLNTFIGWHEGDLARLIFHELAHQVVYAADDTLFNESFATAVERIGGAQWLATQASEATRRSFEVHEARRREFRALVQRTRDALRQAYASGEAPALSAADASNRPMTPVKSGLNAMKSIAMQQFRADYQALRERWGGYAGYDRWVAEANNASFAVQAAYDEWVPAFEALFERAGRDWPRFYDAVRELAALPREQRHKKLKETGGA